MNVSLTAAGKALLVRLLAGEKISMSKIKIGNGAPQDIAEATALNNTVMELEITDMTAGTEYVTLKTSFSNGEVEAGFRITELGVFALDPDNNENEILYAYAYESESAADYVPKNTERILEMQLDVLVFVGDTQNVSAAISSSAVYVSKSDFEKHTESADNPHGVTKAQIGLSNVDNTADKDKPISDATNGELLKIKTLIGSYSNQMNLHTSSKSNPHRVTAEQAGAAPKSHTHSTSDINSGILPVNRGGTGKNNIEDTAAALCGKGGIPKVITGTYIGTGEHGTNHPTSIVLGAAPKTIVVSSGSGYFLAINGDTSASVNDMYSVSLEWSENGVSWYNTKNATYQYNTKDKEYTYFAII